MFSLEWAWAAGLLGPALLFGGSKGALGSTHPLGDGYSMEVWQMEDGLPQNAVTAIVQTKDGYLWLGTYGGLVRFDGIRFMVFDGSNAPELQNGRVTSLAESPEGLLWIGHETGDLTCRKDGRFQAVSRPWPGREPILGMAADRAGKVWLLQESGAFESFEDGRADRLGAREGQTATPLGLSAGAQGAIWVARAGSAFMLEGDHLQPLTIGRAVLPGFVVGIGASRDGAAWVALGSSLRKWRAHQWIEDWGVTPWGDHSVTTLLETQDGSLAVGTINDGLYLWRRDRPPLHLNRANGMPHDWVRSLCEDREGNLWAGTGGGLVRLRAARVRTLDAPDHWQGRAVLSLLSARDGSLWVGTEGAGVYRFKEGTWTRFGAEEGLSNLFVWSVAEDAQGQIWTGTWGGGLLVWRGAHFERAPGLEKVTTSMPALYVSTRTKTLWVGTGAGLLQYQNGQGHWFGAKEGLVAPDVRCVVENQDGVVWFGMSGGGLGRWENGAVRQFRRRDGLTSDFVQCLLLEQDGTVWIGTGDGGINRYQAGRFDGIGTSQGLPSNVICHLAEDHLGNIWVSSHNGLVRVAKADLHRCADGKESVVPCLVYSRSDGLPTLETSGGLQPAGCQTPDGRLWFPTSKGLAVVDPRQVVTNRIIPPVMIEALQVGGRPVALDSRPVRIPPGRQRFEFHYTALSFSAPEKVAFKHRLEGLESDWVQAGAKRAAVYSYLRPGDYTFRVVACNSDGLWNEAGAACTFTVLPFFWETWWFRGMAGIGALSVAGFSVLHTTRRRMRQQLALAQRQQAIERERARIAQDIHDDLGASLTRISLLSQSARADLPNHPQATRQLDQIYATARQLTRAMDEIVWAVNPRHDTLDSLGNYLGRFAQDFLAPAGVRCRLDIPVCLPRWRLTAETRHNLFLAFKESLHNTLKHAGATEVRVALVLESAGFILTVEDNGRGFSLELLAESSAPEPFPESPRNGLTNMRKRLDELGGRCEVESRPGSGTRVRLVVPVPGQST